MPHVIIKCYKGRSEEVLQGCADKVAMEVANTLGCDMSSVSVSVKEYDKEDWKPEVWDRDIAPEMDSLYKKPGYTCS